MRVVLLAIVAGYLAVRVSWLLLRPTLDADVFQRRNYRGHALPTAGGIVIAAGCFIVEAGRSIAGALGVGEATTLTGARILVLLAVAGFTLLGLADDLGAVGRAQGFRGHVRSLMSGHLTTGGLKMLGGGFLALVLAGPADRVNGRDLLATGGGSFIRLLVDASLIALAANLGNLLDRAPGRTVKFSVLLFVVLLVALAVGDSGRVPLLAGSALVIGGGLGILLADLHEHVMLGDTGANALGAALGISAVLTLSPIARVLCAVVLLVLNAMSEVVSFSSVIDGVAPLRAFDRAGTRRERPPEPDGE